MTQRNVTSDPCRELQGCVAIVTGASRGIGRSVAIALAARGVRVACAARDAEALVQTVHACESVDGRAIAVPTDLKQPDDMARLVGTARDKLGPISILVNCAGVMHRGPIGELAPSDLTESFAVNVAALFELTRLVVPDLEHGGAIVNIASIAGRMGSAGGSVYAASKHAVIGFSQSIFEDLRERGVKVCAICPGFVNTDMIVDRDGLDGARMIQPDDVASAVLFVLESSVTVCPTEIVLRPQRSPYR